MDDEFKKQLNNNLKKTLAKFNTNKYNSIRNLYKTNFSDIKQMIDNEGVKFLSNLYLILIMI